MDIHDPEEYGDRLDALEERLDELEGVALSTQQDVTADEQAISQVAADLKTAHETLQQELNAIQAQVSGGTPVDLSKLTAAINGLDPAVQALDALKPEAKAAAAKPLYTFAGADPAAIDTTIWTKTAKTTSDGRPLYEYAHDVAGQPPTGTAAGVWEPYTGVLVG